MKIRIGGLEISDVTPEELDELVKRYGGALPDLSQSQTSKIERNGNGGSGTAPADTVLLRKLVEAGATGCPTEDVGEILGRKGKATRGAVKQWAKRIQLTSGEDLEPFEECRVGTRRGIRIKPSLLDVAKMLLK